MKVTLKRHLLAHPLFNTLLTVERNSRLCLYTEPMFGIPYNLLAPFVTLYMYALGMDDRRIGLLLSLGMALQMVSALMGGVLTDKFGRRKTTFIFDLISWSVPCLIWAFAQNIWWFVVAAVFNALFQIPNIAWGCLLIEDADKSKLVDIYTWVQISGLLAVFFAPISSLFIGQYNLVILMRVLYLILFVSLTTKMFILFLMGKETRQGEIRLRETSGTSIASLLGGYKDILKMVMATRATLLILCFMVLTNIWNLAITNFFGLYANENLQISQQLIPIFPMVRAALMLVIMMTLQSPLNRLPLRPVLLTGLAIYILSHVLLILAPAKNLVMLFGYVMLEGLAFSMVQPRRDSMLVWFVDERQRAQINALIYVIMIGLTSPFGAVIGWLSGIDRRLPFLFNIALFIVAIILIGTSKTLEQLVVRQEDQPSAAE